MKILSSFIVALLVLGLLGCSDSGNPVDSGGNDSDPVVDNCGITDGDNSSCVNYSTEIQIIFDSKCLSCHGSSGGLSLASWDDLMSGENSNGPLVIPEDILNSKLIEKLMLNPSFGDRMPKNDQNYCWHFG